MHFRHTLIALTIALATAAPSWAATYYVAPKGTVISGTSDGSKERPWISWFAALSKAKPGDTLLLKDGNYGGVKINQFRFDGPVTIRSENGKNARFDWLQIQNSRNLVIQNISVWPSNMAAIDRRRLVEAAGSDFVFDGLDVRGGADATLSSYPSWSKEEWGRRQVHGFLAAASRTTVKNSTFTGVHYGIQLWGTGSQALNNVVQGFSGDGIRANGNNSIVRGNRVADCVQVNKDHLDGFQAWRMKGTPAHVGLVLEQNVFLEWANPKTTPLRCKLQGIGMFDGFYDDFSIVNNLVSVSGYHGLIVSGGRKGVIANNTVVNANGNPQGWPWLFVAQRKNGKGPSEDVVVSNNLAMSLRGVSQPENRVVSSANSVIQYPAQVFEDVLKLNYIPKSSSGFVDTGDAAAAPDVDVRNYNRPAGKGPDRGAYEAGSKVAKGKGNANANANASSAPTPGTAGKWLSAP